MKVTLKVWRQKSANDKGKIETYKLDNVSEHMSFLEMMDVLNEQLIGEGKVPVAFDHDCREGICGMCSMHINGEPHGPDRGVTTCQLHMRMFNDGDTIYIEPFRAKGFPVIKDLVVKLLHGLQGTILVLTMQKVLEISGLVFIMEIIHMVTILL